MSLRARPDAAATAPDGRRAVTGGLTDPPALAYASPRMSAAQFEARVTANTRLGGGYFTLELEADAPTPVAGARPGQFVMLRGAWGRELLNPRAFSVLHAEGARLAILAKPYGLGTRRIAQLSGGQQQRVALARALVIRPRCLLLDEPLSNLDAKLRHEMRSEIRRLCKESGLTAIYVTHDRDEALSMADRLAIMNDGRLAQVGTPEEVYRNPVSRMVAEFIGETNFIPGTVQARSSSTHYEVQTAFATLRARTNTHDWQPHHGEKVLLSVRPESLSFGHLADSPNRFPGHIVDTTYLGTHVQYVLQVQDGPEMKVYEVNPRHIRQPSADPMRAMALADDVVMLKWE